MGLKEELAKEMSRWRTMVNQQKTKKEETNCQFQQVGFSEIF
jgi:hypothetical protein